MQQLSLVEVQTRSRKIAPEQMSRLAGYLGIAHKAGKLAAGDQASLAALKTAKANLLVIACDAAPAVWQDLGSWAVRQQVPLLVGPDKQSLGDLLGKSRRGAVVILDAGLAAAIGKLCAE